MERHANYALVGAISLALFIGLTIFVFWLARWQLHKDYDTYDILFVGPVRGLSQGGEVHFNGIKVGEVTDIQLDSRDTTRVIARARVDSKVPVRTDSTATLEPQGITGVNYVQISAGTPSKQLLKATVPAGQIPVIKTQSSVLSDLLEGGGSVLARTIEVLDRVNKVLSDQNIKSLTTSLANIQSITAEIDERKGVVTDIQKTLQSADQAAASIKQTADAATGLVNGPGRETMDKLYAAANDLQGAVGDARTMISNLNGPTTEFATTGLPQVTSAIVSLQSAAQNLDRLAAEIEANPRGLITKTPAKELEVKP
ncbi:MAG: hypothetical protein JWM33_1517 [Caulobacteraceae bacterium]|nr:hypothetical protein [Caulobacteraceae bacterium]